jgi:hypothetical protein
VVAHGFAFCGYQRNWAKALSEAGIEMRIECLLKNRNKNLENQIDGPAPAGNVRGSATAHKMATRNGRVICPLLS